jgi:hypothetical protein
MANTEAGVSPSNEGASAEGTVQENLPQSCVEYGDGGPEILRPEEQQQQPEQPTLTAEELKRLPPELRPGPDGRPPKITEKLLKQMRGHYFTVRHVVLENCGHKLDMINFPKTNCENCLYQFFNTHPQLVEVTDQFFRTHGKGPLIGMRGEKYFKAFVRYMATVIHFMKEEEELKAAQEKANVASGENVTDSTIGDSEARQEREATPGRTSPVEG